MRTPQQRRGLTERRQRHDAVEQLLGLSAECLLVGGLADAEVEGRIPALAAHAHDIGQQQLARTLVREFAADHRVEHPAEAPVGPDAGERCDNDVAHGRRIELD